MTDKIFTIKEYRKIVKAFNEVVNDDDVNYGLMDAGCNDTLNLYTALEGEYSSFSKFADNWQATVAIANPITRDWAIEEFVEKETLYFWTSKKADKDGDNMRLHKINSGAIVPDFDAMSKPSPLTESEIVEWGYNPEKFDRE